MSHVEQKSDLMDSVIVGRSSEPSKMIFVVGSSRSGTTMMGRILGAHPQVNTFGELHFFEQLVDGDDLRARKSWPRARALALLERLLTRSRDGFFASFRPGRYLADASEIADGLAQWDPASVYAAFLDHETRRAGRSVPCEQTPRYIFFADEILTEFPEARIVNMVRDPRDIIISQRSKWRRRSLGASNIPLTEAIRAWANYHPWLVSRLWVSSVRKGLALRDARVRTLRFEDLLSDPVGEVQALCDFLGIAFDAGMLEVPQIGSSSGLDRPDCLGINTERASGWRRGGLSEAERALCEWTSADEMRRIGYTDFLRDGRFDIRFLPLLGSLALKLVVLIPFNLTRAKNIRDALRRRMRTERLAS